MPALGRRPQVVPAKLLQGRLTSIARRTFVYARSVQAGEGKVLPLVAGQQQGRARVGLVADQQVVAGWSYGYPPRSPEPAGTIAQFNGASTVHSRSRSLESSSTTRTVCARSSAVGSAAALPAPTKTALNPHQEGFRAIRMSCDTTMAVAEGLDPDQGVLFKSRLRL